MHRTILRTTCLALCLSGAVAQAQDLRPGVIGTDDRVRITERGPPWDAVGQVNVGGVHFCTGTLVAPDVVVSAAHCVTNENGRPYGLRDIHYLAAVEGSSWKAHGTARCLKFLPGFAEPS